MEIVSRIHSILKDDGVERIKKSSTFQSIRSNFVLTEKEAIALAIIRQLSDSLPTDSCNMTQEQAEDIIKKRFGLGLDIKAVMEAITSWTENGLVYKHISIPSWIKHILPEDPMPSCLTANNPHLSETAEYLEMDSHIASVIKHAISSRTPMMLRIETKFGLEDLYIIKKQLSEYGIPAFILDGPECTSAGDDPISGALYTYHHQGIMLVPSSFCGFSEIMDNEVGKRLSLRWGGYKPENNDSDEFDSENSQALEERKKLQKRGVLVIDTALSYITGNKLLSAYRKSFGESEAKTICSFSSEFGMRPDTVLTYKPLVSEILRTKDEESLKIVLQSFKDREKPSGSILLDNAKYDISIINADVPIGIIEKMALKAVSEKKPLRLLFTGPSGTGKSAFAHHIAASLGVPLMSKKPGDIYSDRFGDSEKILERIFSTASAERAILLLDEIDSYISRKTNAVTAGAKTYNELANCFLQEMEGFNGMMIGTTNYLNLIEPAFLRRFQRVVDFGFPSAEGISKLFSLYFPKIQITAEDITMLAEIEAIGPGDFASLKSLTDYMEPDEITSSFIVKSLVGTAEARSGKRWNPIGFR